MLSQTDAHDVMECIYWAALGELDPNRLYKLSDQEEPEDVDEVIVESLEDLFAGWLAINSDNSAWEAKHVAQFIAGYLVDSGFALPMETRLGVRINQELGRYLAVYCFHPVAEEEPEDGQEV